MGKASYGDMTGPNGLLANRAPFQGNSLSAEWTTFRPAAGRLDDLEFSILAEDWYRACAANKRMYVVYSYSTPIAWALDGECAYCAEQKFSVTTSKGQTYVRAWINYYYTTKAACHG